MSSPFRTSRFRLEMTSTRPYFLLMPSRQRYGSPIGFNAIAFDGLMHHHSLQIFAVRSLAAERDDTAAPLLGDAVADFRHGQPVDINHLVHIVCGRALQSFLGNDRL